MDKEAHTTVYSLEEDTFAGILSRSLLHLLSKKTVVHLIWKTTLTQDILIYLMTNYYNTLLEAGEWSQPSQ
jgi:hypothetical protein